MTDHTPTPGEQRPTDDTAAVPTAPDESIPATPAADAATPATSTTAPTAADTASSPAAPASSGARSSFRRRPLTRAAKAASAPRR